MLSYSKAGKIILAYAKDLTKHCIGCPCPLPSPLCLVSCFTFPESGLIADSVMQNLLSIVFSYDTLHIFSVCCNSSFSVLYLLQNPVLCCFQINFQLSSSWIFFTNYYHSKRFPLSFSAWCFPWGYKRL